MLVTGVSFSGGDIMPWLDIFLIAVVMGQGASGYFASDKALARLMIMVLLLVIALPLARPLGREIGGALPGLGELAWEDRFLLPVAGGEIPVDLGPWQASLGVPAGTGPEQVKAYLSRIQGLIMAVIGYLTGLAALAFPLMLVFNGKGKPTMKGLAVGLVGGMAAVLLLLVLIPPLALTSYGGFLAQGLEESALSNLLLPVTTWLVQGVARFFL